MGLPPFNSSSSFFKVPFKRSTMRWQAMTVRPTGRGVL
jgi:hypothetical protein